jgi:hypothetical protein
VQCPDLRPWYCQKKKERRRKEGRKENTIVNNRQKEIDELLEKNSKQ